MPFSLSSSALNDYQRFLSLLVGNDAYVDTPPLTVDYLVVAGGASGGGVYGAGGGGAGGYRTSAGTSGGGASAESSLSLFTSTNYTVTVGAGGASTTSTTSAARGNSGSNSVFATITSNGGGAGAGDGAGNTPLTGGSGGGSGTANSPTTGAAGTANQGYAGGSHVWESGNNYSGGGGGGGAGAVGASGAASGNVATGGNGGNGVASSITGTSVTRAGGGGGGAYGTGESAVQSSGGSGGGGAGGTGNNGALASPIAATVNTGGGGGGSGWGQLSGAGGSGVVIIKYPIVYDMTVSAGLGYKTVMYGEYKITEFTAGTGTVSFALAPTVTGFSEDILQEIVLEDSAASVTFANLDQYAGTYQHLQIRTTARSDRASDTNSRLYLRFNSDSGANYFSHELGGTGSSVFSSYINSYTGSYNTGIVNIHTTPASSAPANAFGGCVYDILDPFETTKYTTTRFFGGQAQSHNRVVLVSGAWANTDALTSITITDIHGNLITGSRFTLIGVK